MKILQQQIQYVNNVHNHVIIVLQPVHIVQVVLILIKLLILLINVFVIQDIL